MDRTVRGESMSQDADAPNSTGAEGRGTLIFRLCIGLVLVTWIAFEAVLRSGFIGFDDGGEIEAVKAWQRIQDGFPAWASTGAYYVSQHPSTVFSHWLDVQLFGVDPSGHHLTSLLLHIANVLLVFGLFTRTSGAVWRSAFVAALFALHPLQVEAVAWVSERNQVLGGFFGLLAIWAYAGYSNRGGVGRYGLTLALVAVALMADPMLALLPLVFLLFDYWPLDRFARDRRGSQDPGHPSAVSLLVEKIPFLVLSAISSGIAVIHQSDAISLPLGLRGAHALVSSVGYLGKIVWPTDLSMISVHPFLAGGVPWTPWQGIGAGLLVLGISAVAVRRRYSILGWFWYLLALLPALGAQVGHEAMADRFAYLPLIGVFVILVWGGAEAVAAVPSSQRWAHRSMFVGAVAVALVGLAGTRAQTLYWTNARVLYLHALDVGPTNPLIHYNLARVLAAEGQSDEAVEHYRLALKADSHHEKARRYLARALADRGELDESIDEFRRLLELRPNAADAHNNLGVLLESRGERAEAIRHYRRALEAVPEYADAHFNLGTAMVAQGEMDEAIQHFRRALELAPNFARAHNNLGNALLARNEIDPALEHYREALRIDPALTSAKRNLEAALELIARRESGETAP